MDSKVIDSYLYNEMSEAEREKFENEFFADGDTFTEIADRENDLVDRYVRNEISGEELARFERALDATPARRQKIANAQTIREFIADERPAGKTITIAERRGFFSSLFSPAFQFASIGLIAILAAAAVFLVIENRRLNSLSGELAQARARESELASLVESHSETASELTRDLDAERDRIAKLENELRGLRGGGGNSSSSSSSLAPIIATLVLSPSPIRTSLPKRLNIPSGVTQVSTVVTGLPEKSERVSIRLNGQEIARNVKVRTTKGEKNISVLVPAARLSREQNQIDVIGESGEQLASYTVEVKR